MRYVTKFGRLHIWHAETRDGQPLAAAYDEHREEWTLAERGTFLRGDGSGAEYLDPPAGEAHAAGEHRLAEAHPECPECAAIAAELGASV